MKESKMKTSDQKPGVGLVSGLALSAVLVLSGCAKDLMDGPVMAKRESHWDLRDDDRDGVINHRDQCSGTPAGSKVDVDGCT
jgi:hypothetical protein